MFWRRLEEVVRDVMSQYGAAEIRTPILEPTELIARGVGASSDIVTKEMFAFERGSTNYVMRPEVTAPGDCGPTCSTALLRKAVPSASITLGLVFVPNVLRKAAIGSSISSALKLLGLRMLVQMQKPSFPYGIFWERLGIKQYSLRLNSLGRRGEPTRPFGKP